MTANDERLRIVRAALAEVGVDPELVRSDGETLFWRSAQIDSAVMWRAFTIAYANEGRARCRACWDRYVARRDPSETRGCQAIRSFTLDCGRPR